MENKMGRDRDGMGNKDRKNQVDMKQNIIIGLLVANLLFSLVFIYNRQNDLNNQLGNMESQVSMLSNQVNRISSDVVYQMNQMEEEAMNMVSDFDYSYIGFNADDRTIETKLSVDLKERKEDGIVYFLLVDEEGEGLQVESSEPKLLSFSVHLDLNMDKNYSLKVIEESASGSRQLNTKKYHLDLKSDFYDRRVEMTGSSGGSNGKCVYYNKGFQINNYGIDGFGLEEVKFIMTMDEEKIYEEVVTDQLINLDTLSAHELLRIEAGEMLEEVPSDFGGGSSQEVVAEEVYEAKREAFPDIDIDQDFQRYYFQKIMVYDEYPDLHIGPDKMYRVDGYLVVTFKDGSSQQIH